MPKLKASDLEIGMHVTGEQLSDIYGVWIYVNPLTENYGEYDILYFCDENTKNDDEIKKIFDQFGKISVIYQPAVYEDEDAEIYD